MQAKDIESPVYQASGASAAPSGWLDSQMGPEDLTPLTAQEAAILERRQPPLQLGAVWLWQAALASCLVLLAAVLAHSILGRPTYAVWLAGAWAVLLPQLLMILGVGRGIGRQSASIWLARWFVWEIGKLVLTLTLLVVAAWWGGKSSWLQLLLAFILTLKAGWLAAWLQHRRQRCQH